MAAFTADFLRGLLGWLLVDIETFGLGAFAGVTGRDRAADTGRGTGDNSNMVFEQGHGIFLGVFLSLLDRLIQMRANRNRKRYPWCGEFGIHHGGNRALIWRMSNLR